MFASSHARVGEPLHSFGDALMWMVPIALVIMVITLVKSTHRARLKGAAALFVLMLGGLAFMYFIDFAPTFFVGGMVVLYACYALMRQCIVMPYSFRFLPLRARRLLVA